MDSNDVAKLFGAVIYSRHDAAEVLKEVADCCESGHFPQKVTPSVLGKSVARAMVNCPNGKTLRANFEEFCKGFWEVRDEDGVKQ